MTLYSTKREYPVEGLPDRIRLSNGFTKTDSSTFTSDDLADAGIVAVSNPPNYDFKTHSLSWGGADWVLTELTDQEKQNQKREKWVAMRLDRDNLIKAESANIEKYLSEQRRGVSTTVDITKLDTYVEALRQVPQNNDDPWNIDWPDHWEVIDD
tara:strand:- start:2305 stop:2766 length:462 start_codon:yes stop_codon:yes gene_type:complete